MMEDQNWIDCNAKYQTDVNNNKTKVGLPYEPCTAVTVTILSGRRISVGLLHDFWDTPDPKVSVKCETAVGQKKFKTKIARNSVNPEWNESFTFVFPENVKNAQVQIEVREADRYKHDPHLMRQFYEIYDLKENEPKIYTLEMKKHGEVDLQFLKRRRISPDIRMCLSLSVEESNYRMKRREKAMVAIRQLLGEEKGPRTLKETPTIALAVTGGGYRAMIASCGAMEALVENKIFDATMYFAALSGSAWYLSTTYYHKALADINRLRSHHDWMRRQMEKRLVGKLIDTSFWQRYRQYRSDKVENKQKITLVDLFGLLLGETFLDPENPSATLSSLKEYVDTGDVPFPIISCAHVCDKLHMSDFWDEVEMTPVEVSLPSYGFNIPTEKFNSVWSRGILQHDLPEPPLHYLMGTSGSAFAIMTDKICVQMETENVLQDFIKDTHRGILEGEFSKYGDEIDGNLPETGYNNYAPNYNSRQDESKKRRPPSKIEHYSRKRVDMQTTGGQSVVREGTTKADGCCTTKVPNFSSTGESCDCKEVDHCLEKSLERTAILQSPICGRSFLIDRTAKVNNCATGFQKLKKYLFNTESIESKRSINNRIKNKMSTEKPNIALCDPGIGCNLPTVHVMRPQRTVDVLIVVDCSLTLDKDSLDISCFTTVQSQISDHGIKFPHICVEKIAKDPFREVYLFEDPNDPECPIVLWFTLANGTFQNLENPPRRPGYPTPDPVDNGGEKFNDFYVSKDASEFSTLNFSFSSLNFDRVRELMKYNIDSNIQLVKEKIADKVKQLRDKN